LVGFSLLLVPVALILSIVGLFWPQSRRLALAGLVLSGAMLLLIFVPRLFL
jgi:hypothetical protein